MTGKSNCTAMTHSSYLITNEKGMANGRSSKGDLHGHGGSPDRTGKFSLNHELQTI